MEDFTKLEILIITIILLYDIKLIREFIIDGINNYKKNKLKHKNGWKN